MTDASFWDRIATRYAARPVADPDAYAATLERTRSYLKPSDDVLEVGCGTGTTALKLAPAVRSITATDYAGAMIEIAESKRADQGVANVTFRQAGLDDLGDRSHDAVLAFNILHLVEDVPAALAALAQRVKPGGYLISKTACMGGASVWRLVLPFMRMIGKAPYVGFFGARDLDRMIEAAGFQIVETGSYPKPQNHFVVARKF